MQFENWNYANLVLLAYGQQIGFVWRIQDKYLDKNGGVYKYIFEYRHNPKNDTSNLLKELQKMKEDDPTWFITYHCVKNCLFHLFWMSPHQQILYLRHHDVILTDNTARSHELISITLQKL
ncbi:hypothetical protein RhiirA1_479088 [Rhizophagus irregularis]|uniref:Uncharacterized protein n=1 Tax=Rhizophagus irregularis TaxID=588596 RepID=A0A2N0QR67_9GLOM|nr:hypothetical protein RhiirA1_479088 [Rhizophagus irregularis]GBC43775.2 hypothetical protein GLOIN_2v1470742 [Rhizophagus irregularis DAOM 181602=DAOM 197198]